MLQVMATRQGWPFSRAGMWQDTRARLERHRTDKGQDEHGDLEDSGLGGEVIDGLVEDEQAGCAAGEEQLRGDDAIHLHHTGKSCLPRQVACTVARCLHQHGNLKQNELRRGNAIHVHHRGIDGKLERK